MSKNPIFTFLHQQTLGALGEKTKVITLSDKDTVEKAVRILTENRILSAPVLNDQGVCLGLVDMLDIVWTVLKVAPEPVKLGEIELRSLEIAGRAMAWEPLKNIIGASGRDPYVPVYENNPASSVVDLFAKGIHRAPIYNEAGQIINSISQSSIIKFLSENLHMGTLKAIGALKVKDLGLGLQPPVTVHKGSSVLHVLKTIQGHGISAVALIEEDGKLGGNFSATDLVGLYQEQWPSLALPVADYLANHSPNSLNGICCTLETSLLEVTKEMTSSGVHRLWVLDPRSFSPIGLVSTTDIFKVIRDFSFA